MNMKTFHQGGVEIQVKKEDIHYVQPRSFGDVTFGSIIITPEGKIEVDESVYFILEMFK